MIAVSNTSPIVTLASVGQLALLQQLYGTIVIPEAVYREIVIRGAGKAGSREVQTLSWFQTRQVVDCTPVTSLQLGLGKGETEAIALALELKADLLLVDERRARAAASLLALRFTGLLGVLVEAKHKGIVSLVKPVLDELIAKAGFWVDAKLLSQVLQAVGE